MAVPSTLRQSTEIARASAALSVTANVTAWVAKPSTVDWSAPSAALGRGGGGGGAPRSRRYTSPKLPVSSAGRSVALDA